MNKIIWDELATIDIEEIREDYPNNSDRELEAIADELLYQGLDDEKQNLDIEVNGKIVCIASIGRWNGRYDGYKLLGNNISDIFQKFVQGHSYARWYMNEKDEICGEEIHHDATNYYTYRMIAEQDVEQFEQADNPFDWLMQHSKPIAENVKQVYGW